MDFSLIFGFGESIKGGNKKSIFFENISNMFECRVFYFYSRAVLEVIFEAPVERKFVIQS